MIEDVLEMALVALDADDMQAVEAPQLRRERHRVALCPDLERGREGERRRPGTKPDVSDQTVVYPAVVGKVAAAAKHHPRGATEAHSRKALCDEIEEGAAARREQYVLAVEEVPFVELLGDLVAHRCLPVWAQQRAARVGEPLETCGVALQRIPVQHAHGQREGFAQDVPACGGNISARQLLHVPGNALVQPGQTAHSEPRSAPEPTVHRMLEMINAFPLWQDPHSTLSYYGN